MKKLILTLVVIITAVFTTSCSTDDIVSKNNIEVKELVELPDYYIGEYIPHHGELAKGNIIITKDIIVINVEGHYYKLFIHQLDTKLEGTCYYTIYIDGNIIRINDYISENNFIVLEINNEVIGVFDKI